MNTASLRIIIGKIRWLTYEVFTSLFDAAFWFLHLPVTGTPGLAEKNKKRIVFIGELLPPRTPRLAKWIIRSGNYTAVLVCSKRGFVKKFSDPCFEATLLFRNKWHLRRVLRGIPDVYLLHSFAPKSYYPDIARLALKVPFIHDMQDVYATYYGLHPSMPWLKRELPHEQACLEQADGVIGHSLEPNVAYRKYQTKNKPPNLFFPLYCDDDFFCNTPKSLNPDDIHIVYAGGVAGSHRNPKQYGNIQFHQLIKTLSAQKLHFHIYPSPSNVRADYEEYEEIAKENPFFHFHEPVAQQDLAKELSQYHFGILPFFKELSEQSGDKLKYATTLKLFNYLEAGIPIIVSKDLGYQSWLTERYSCGIGIRMEHIQELKTLINKTNYKTLLAAVQNSRTKLSLGRQTKRLENFYQRM
jgi:hypothetical protein